MGIVLRSCVKLVLLSCCLLWLLGWLFPTKLGPFDWAGSVSVVHPASGHYVIFHFDSVEMVSRLVWTEAHRSATLSPDDLQRLEALFQQKIGLFNQKAQLDWMKARIKYPKFDWQISDFIIFPNRYVRQYFPAENSRGEKEVWVNCHCDASDYWREAPMFVKDGGNCHFSMYINLTTGKVYRLNVNGTA